jgi:nitronate monooxygenase
MAGLTDEHLVSAASKAGVIGSLGGGGMDPARLRATIRAIRERTDRPFNVNLFVIDDMRGRSPDAAALILLRSYYDRIALPFPEPGSWAPDFDAQLQVLLDEAPGIVSFAFGMPDRERLEALRRRNIQVIGTATTVAEVLAWADAGAEMVSVQGLEAGGHRGHFLGESEGAGLMALLQEVRAATTVPIAAAGGIMTGAAIAACRLLGAEAVQMGTAFLCCDETPTPPAFRAVLLDGGKTSDDTTLTKAFSGRSARGIRNRFIDRFRHESVPPYPIQNALTQPLRAAAAARDDAEEMSLWAGQGLTLVRPGSVAALVDRLAADYRRSAPSGIASPAP